jgi:hypothetical protein
VSVEFFNQYPEKLRDIIIVLPNGDGIHMDKVPQGSSLQARVLIRGDGPVELIVENANGLRVREVIIAKPPKGMGGRVKVTLDSEFSLKK